MKQLFRVALLLLLVALIAAPAAAQEKERKKRKRDVQQQRGQVAALMRRLEKAKLSEEQLAKCKEIAAKYQPKLKELTQAVKLEPPQREAGAVARKKAAEEGKKGKEVREAVEAAMKLTDQQKEARGKLQELQGEMQKEVMALLTPEQRQALGVGAKRKADAGRERSKRGKKRQDADQ